MISNFKLFPNINISQNFVQNVQKQKKNTFVLSCLREAVQEVGLFTAGYETKTGREKMSRCLQVQVLMSTSKGFLCPKIYEDIYWELFVILQCQLRTEVFFCFCTFWTKFCDILKYGNNLKLEIINYIFRKIITLNEVNILESPNEYYQKQV